MNMRLLQQLASSSVEAASSSSSSAVTAATAESIAAAAIAAAHAQHQHDHDAAAAGEGVFVFAVVAVHVAALAELHHYVQLALVDKRVEVGYHVRVIRRRQQLHLLQRALLLTPPERLDLDLFYHVRKPIGVPGHAKDAAKRAGAQLRTPVEVGAHGHHPRWRRAPLQQLRRRRRGQSSRSTGGQQTGMSASAADVDGLQ